MQRPYTMFGKTRLVNSVIYQDGVIANDQASDYDREMWIERGEDWYALTVRPHLRTLVVTPNDWRNGQDVPKHQKGDSRA